MASKHANARRLAVCIRNGIDMRYFLISMNRSFVFGRTRERPDAWVRASYPAGRRLVRIKT
jgi:hypothetical protein